MDEARQLMLISFSRIVLVCASSLALALASGGCEAYHPSNAAAPGSIASPAPVAPATPAPPVEVYGCGLPRGAGLGYDCHKESPQLMDAVNEAIDRAEIEHPELFRDLFSTGGAYMDQVVENLREKGFCALNDKGEEIAVKNSNDFSEQYDILSGGGNVLRAYMVTCRPAWDAIPPAGDNS